MLLLTSRVWIPRKIKASRLFINFASDKLFLKDKLQLYPRTVVKVSI
jgi:hypothetical protein